MRISTSHIYLKGVQSFGDQQVKLAKLQEQISTGLRITRPSDDPAASARVLELEQAVSQMEQYNVNINLAEARLKLEESTLNAVENVYFRVKELTVQANNSALSTTDLKAIGTEINQKYQELLSLANTVDNNGSYLFAGFQSDSPPFEQTQTGSIRHVQYVGDQGQRSVQISPTRQIATDNPGSHVFLQLDSNLGLRESAATANGGNAVIAPADVFDTTAYTPGDFQIVFTSPTTYDIVDLSGPTNLVTAATYADNSSIEFNGIRTSISGTPNAGDSFDITQGRYRDIFTTLNGLTDTLNSEPSNIQRAANLSQAQADIESFFNRVLDVRTSIGGRLNALQTQFDNNDAIRVSTRETISTLRDVDLAEAISQLTLEQTTLDAAQAIFARITSSSLFNFLR